MTAGKPKTKHIPQFEIESIARMLLPKIQAYFENERGRREFEEWKSNLKPKEE